MEDTQITKIEPQGDEKTWALISHLSCIFLGWVLALVIYLTQKDKGPFVKAHAIEALNWQLTFSIGIFASAILIFIGIGLILIPAILLCDIIFGVIGAMKANSGEMYKYPFSIKFVK
jgi:uncharacterized Tic20 family protein